MPRRKPEKHISSRRIYFRACPEKQGAPQLFIFANFSAAAGGAVQVAADVFP